MNESLIFLFVAVLLIGVALFALMTLSKRSSRLDVEKYRSRWLAVEQSLVRDNESSYHLAILNADKLVDQALKDAGIGGKTMGDRMKAANKRFTHRDDIWSAHKLRNKIAHEPDVRVGYEQSRHALAGFKRALKDLGAI